ncbi:MoxR family ATPase [Streptomyces longisporus]|jgi:MoxR-like ATPase|uniref:MoxR family ATPase n=1 Tax=Streptomyces longisporus TaxID=1948 RepID=A0ABN3KTY7_STRLO
MTWGSYYRGDGVTRDVSLGAPPPWREFPRRSLGIPFQPPDGLPEAVNAALSLRRPLLITGTPGSGKSTVIESVAEELRLGPVLRWHITSRSTLSEALYRYDVLGRIHDQQLAQPSRPADDIAHFLQLGPLGTSMIPSPKPRCLLIDELDKSDLDLPSDLLEVLERGEFEIPELTRYNRKDVDVRMWDSEERHRITRGRVQCTEFPFIVMTSNGERDFPAAFLRRCIRFVMPKPDNEAIRKVVLAHLGLDVTDSAPLADLVRDFVTRIQAGDSLAVDQLLNALFVVAGDDAPRGAPRERVLRLLLQDLNGG